MIIFSISFKQYEIKLKNYLNVNYKTMSKKNAIKKNKN